MEKSEMLYIATKYKQKGYSKEEMRYGDDCYELSGEEGRKIKDEIAEYMDEYEAIGRIAFYEKYSEFTLF